MSHGGSKKCHISFEWPLSFTSVTTYDKKGKCKYLSVSFFDTHTRNTWGLNPRDRNGQKSVKCKIYGTNYQ